MRRSLAILALYLLLATVCTYPLAFNLATQAPAGEAWTYDGFSMLWNLWWFKHALLDLQANPFVTHSLFAPLGVSLYLHSYTVFSDLVALPLLAWLNPAAASNLILIGSLALCGYGMYLAAKFQLSGGAATPARGMQAGEIAPDAKAASQPARIPLEGAAFVAGIVYAFTTSRFVFLAEGHYNFFTTEWLPFYLLYLLKALQRPSRRTIGLAALFLALALLVELSLGVMLVLLTGLYWVFSHGDWRRRASQLAVIAAVGAVAVVLLSPYLIPTARESFDPRYIPQYWGGAPMLSADVVGMFTPSSLNTFLGTHDWPREWLQVLQDKGRFVGLNAFVIGFGVLGMALLGAAVERRARIWLWLALVLVVLSWGPVLHINGQSVFDLDGMKVIVGLPYIILHYVPLLNDLRAPHRFSVVALMALAMLAGCGTAWVLARAQMPALANRRAARVVSGVLIAAVCGIVGFEHVNLPLPLADTTVPAIYQRIGQEPGDFTIMDIPLGWRSGFGPVGTENTRLQYFQTVHGKPLISGFAARTPSFIFDYFQREPILGAIAQLESEGRLPAGEALRSVVRAGR